MDRRRQANDLTSVLHVSQPGSEGVGNYVSALAAEQLVRGRLVAIACPPGTPLAATAAADGVPVLPWQATRLPGPGVADELARLRRIVADLGPGIVHLHSSKAGMIGRMALRGHIPTVFQPHAWSFEALAPPVDRLSARWERTASAWTDALVTVSAGEHAIAQRNGIGAKQGATTVPNPVDTRRFRPAASADPAPELLRGTLGLTDEPIVACPGRLCHQKGQDVLLRAWPHVRARVPHARLVLIGDGPGRAELEATADDSVHLLGNRSDVAEILRSVQVVAMPSRWEGMALAMLEAMASGCPVVVTDVGGAAETVGHGAGSVVPVGSVERLAEEVVRRLLDTDLAEREGRVGRELTMRHHTLGATADAIDEIYRAITERVAAGHRPGALVGAGRGDG